MSSLENIGRLFMGESMAEIFSKLRVAMLNADVAQSRIGDTLELLNPTIVLTNPRKRLMYSDARAYNLVYGIVEAFMLCNTTNSVRPFALFNKKIVDYSDDNRTLNSAYGSHIAQWLPEIIEKLKKDKCTRQAALNIYSTKFGVSETKDVPCTIALHFLVRDGKLNLTTYMRSNDLFWGFQYDLFMFTALQEIVANSVGIPLGVYTHCDTSLHVYEYHWGLLREMTPQKVIDIPEINFGMNFNEAAEISEKFRRLSRAVYSYGSGSQMLGEIGTEGPSIHQLVLLEFMFRYERDLFENVKEEIDLGNGWWAPFTKRWK